MRGSFDIKGKNEAGKEYDMMILITRIHPTLRSVGRCAHWKAQDEWFLSTLKSFGPGWKIHTSAFESSIMLVSRTKKRTPKNWEQGKVKCLHLESKITTMAMLVGELNQFLFLCVRYTYGWKAEKSQSYWRVIHVIDELHFISGERQISIFEWLYFSSIELVCMG